MVKIDKKEKTKKLVDKLLRLMGTQAKAEVSQDETSDTIVVNIQSETETGLIIGNRGRTLNSIQMLVGLMLKTKIGEWQRIVVDVADWREKEEDRLKKLAEQVADRVKTTNESQPLYNLTPSQRRIVHIALANDSKIRTESTGEGKDRYLVVHPKK